MVSMLSILQRAENTMKNTIDDADYIIILEMITIL